MLLIRYPPSTTSAVGAPPASVAALFEFPFELTRGSRPYINQRNRAAGLDCCRNEFCPMSSLMASQPAPLLPVFAPADIVARMEVWGRDGEQIDSHGFHPTRKSTKVSIEPSL